MRIISFSDARNSLRAVIDQVVEDADVTVISRRDAPDAVVMSFEHYSRCMDLSAGATDVVAKVEGIPLTRRQGPFMRSVTEGQRLDGRRGSAGPA